MLDYKSKEEFLNLKPNDLSPLYQFDGQRSEDKARVIIQECLKTGHARFEWLHLRH